MAYDDYGQDDLWGGGQQEDNNDPWGVNDNQSQQQSNPWPTSADPYRNQLQQVYKQYLGREASDQELTDQFGGQYTQGRLNAVMSGTIGSQEAKDYAARQAQPQQQSQPQQDNSGQGSQQPTNSWDTDGYQAPQYTAPITSGPPPGWEAGKWADPNHQTPKYVVGRILVQNDPRSPEGRAAIIADIQKAYPGATFNGKDKINIPGVGNNIDIFQGAGAGQYNAQWLTEENQGGGDPNAGGGGFPGGGGGFGGGYGSGGSGGYGSGSGSSSGSTNMTYTSGIAPPPGMNEELWKMLMERSKQGLNVDRSDPNVRSQADAYSAQEERARRNYLGDAAESSSPYGTGAMAGMERITAAQMGARVGGMEAQLVGKEIAARREEIAHALSEMGDLLTDQQRMQLQKDLAEMDNSLERLRIETQNGQYYAGLAQQDSHHDDQLGYNYWNSNLDNAYRTGVHRDNFGRQVGQDNAMWDWVQRGNKPF